MTYSSTSWDTVATVRETTFLQKTMLWLAVAFGAAAVGTIFIGPLVPRAFILPLSLVAVGAMLAAAFVRKHVEKISGALAIAIPLILGITLYPTLNYFISSGAAGTVVLAAAGSAFTFGTIAFFAWTSKKSLQKWSSVLFFVLLGAIGMSLLNVFLLQLPLISLLISIVAVGVFAVYSWIDVQNIRDSVGLPAAAALSVFLDIFGLFANLLNILSFFDE